MNLCHTLIFYRGFYLLVEINMHSMVTLPSIHLAGMVKVPSLAISVFLSDST